MSNFEISVIIPVYNSERFLRSAVTSVLHQKISHVQIIVVDDGSTDNSLETISDLAVDIIRLPKNQGVAAARNAGLKAAKGRYITFLDSDDILSHDSLKWRYDFLEGHANFPAVAGRPAGVIDGDSKPIESLKHLLEKSFKIPEFLTVEFYKNGGTFPVVVWNYMFRKEFVDQIGEFQPSLKIGEDFDFLMRALEISKIPVCFKPVVFRRIHDQNLSVIYSEGRLSLRDQAIDACRDLSSNLLGKEQLNYFPWETGYKAS